MPRTVSASFIGYGWRCSLLALVLLLLAAWSVQAQPASEPRLALVIGNAKYKTSPLANPVNDARLMEAALKEAGFQVIKAENASLRDMRRLVRDFGDRLKATGGVGLFYFAGHGVQVRGENYLISIDSDIRNEDEVADDSINAQLVLEKMQSAGNRMNLVILDACRNNPFTVKSRSAQSGLATMSAPSGSLVAYATAPGAVASDGSGSNGLYTQHLARTMRQPGLPVEEVFKQVRASVRKDSNNQQTPWENTALEGQFFFKPGVVAAAAPAPRPEALATPAPGPSAGPTETAELAFWDSVKSSGSSAELQAYLNRFPNGIFAELARSRLAALHSGRPTAATAPVPAPVQPSVQATAVPVAPAVPLPAATSAMPQPAAATVPVPTPAPMVAPAGARYAFADQGTGRLTITDTLTSKAQPMEVAIAANTPDAVRYSSGDVIGWDGTVRAVRIGGYVGTLQSGALWRLPLQPGTSGVARLSYPGIAEAGELRWKVVPAAGGGAEVDASGRFPGISYSGALQRGGFWRATYQAQWPLPVSARLEARLIGAAGNSQPELLAIAWRAVDAAALAVAPAVGAAAPTAGGAAELGHFVMTDGLTKLETRVAVRVSARRDDATEYSTGDVVATDGTVLAAQIGNVLVRPASGGLWRLPLQAGASGSTQVQATLEGRLLTGEVQWRVVRRSERAGVLEVKVTVMTTPPSSGNWTATYDDGLALPLDYQLTFRRISGLETVSARLQR